VSLTPEQRERLSSLRLAHKAYQLHPSTFDTFSGRQMGDAIAISDALLADLEAVEAKLADTDDELAIKSDMARRCIVAEARVVAAHAAIRDVLLEAYMLYDHNHKIHVFLGTLTSFARREGIIK